MWDVVLWALGALAIPLSQLLAFLHTQGTVINTPHPHLTIPDAPHPTHFLVLLTPWCRGSSQSVST